MALFFISLRCGAGHGGVGESPQEPVDAVVAVYVGGLFDVEPGRRCAVDGACPYVDVGGVAVAVVRVAGGDGVDQASRSAGRQFIAGFDALGELGDVVLRTAGGVGIKCPSVGALVEQASARSAFLGGQGGPSCVQAVRIESICLGDCRARVPRVCAILPLSVGGGAGDAGLGIGGFNLVESQEATSSEMALRSYIRVGAEVSASNAVATGYARDDVHRGLDILHWIYPRIRSAVFGVLRAVGQGLVSNIGGST